MATDVGSSRIPVTGERAGADFAGGPCAYQLKVRRALPQWLFAWLDGICAAGAKRGKVGALVLNLPRRPRRDALVVVRWQDWQSLIEQVQPENRT